MELVFVQTRSTAATSARSFTKYTLDICNNWSSKWHSILSPFLHLSIIIDVLRCFVDAVPVCCKATRDRRSLDSMATSVRSELRTIVLSTAENAVERGGEVVQSWRNCDGRWHTRGSHYGPRAICVRKMAVEVARPSKMKGHLAKTERKRKTFIHWKPRGGTWNDSALSWFFKRIKWIKANESSPNVWIIRKLIDFLPTDIRSLISLESGIRRRNFRGFCHFSLWKKFEKARSSSINLKDAMRPAHQVKPLRNSCTMSQANAGAKRPFKLQSWPV